jgi:hypothetical protein
MKEVFITINVDEKGIGWVAWYGPNTSGSNPVNNNQDEVLVAVMKLLKKLADSRAEEWCYRISGLLTNKV